MKKNNGDVQKKVKNEKLHTDMDVKRYVGAVLEEVRKGFKVGQEHISGVEDKVDNLVIDMADVKSDIRDMKFDIKWGLKDKADKKHFADLDTRVRKLEK